MKSIKEKSEELSTAFRKEQGDVGYSEQLSYKLGIEAGANYVLDEIEEFMTNLNLGSNAAEKFYKLDLMADIHGFIEQLKGNQ